MDEKIEIGCYAMYRRWRRYSHGYHDILVRVLDGPRDWDKARSVPRWKIRRMDLPPFSLVMQTLWVAGGTLQRLDEAHALDLAARIKAKYAEEVQ